MWTFLFVNIDGQKSTKCGSPLDSYAEVGLHKIPSVIISPRVVLSSKASAYDAVLVLTQKNHGRITCYAGLPKKRERNKAETDIGIKSAVIELVQLCSKRSIMNIYIDRSTTALSLAVLIGLTIGLTVLLGLTDVGKVVLGQAKQAPNVVVPPLTIYPYSSDTIIGTTLTGTLSYTHHFYLPLVLNNSTSPAWILLGLDEIPIKQIVTSGYDTETVYAVPDTSQILTGTALYKSDDGGRNWYPSFDGIAGRVQSLFVHPITPTMLLAGTLMGEGVYYSYDSGEHWVSSPMYPFVRAIAAHPTTPTLWLAATYNPSIWGSAYIHRTNNAGVMWHTVTSQPLIVNAFLFDSDDLNRVYACTAGGVKCSDDAGLTWNHVASSGCNDLAMHPYTSTIMYTNNKEGVLKTVDSGMHWTRVLTQSISAIALDPVNPTLVYASTPNTLFRSTNAGRSWEQVDRSTEVSFEYISDLAVNHSGALYVGTDRGIWVVLFD